MSALALYEKAKPILIKYEGAEGAHVSDTMVVMANLYNNLGMRDKALQMAKDVLALQEKQHATDPTDRQTTNSLANGLNDIANMYRDARKFQQALQVYERSLELTVAIHGREHDDVAKTLNNMALANKSLGQSHWPQALQKYKEARDLLIRLKGKEHPEVATITMNLAVLYSQMKKSELALPLALEAMAVQEKVYGQDHPTLIGCYVNLANIYTSLRTKDTLEQAVIQFRKGIAVTQRVHGENYPSLARLFANLGRLYFRLKQREDAIRAYTEAVANLDFHKKEGAPEPQAAVKVRAEATKVCRQLQRSMDSLRKIDTGE